MTLRLRVTPELRYVGSHLFELRGLAVVERHIFVEGASDVVRMLVVHFEAFLAGVDDLYRYALHDTRVLGGEGYGRMASVMSLRAEIEESPGAEMAHTQEFIRSKGLRIGDRHAVARYARIVGEDRRKEVLIFYHEVDGSTEGIYERAESAMGLIAAP